MLLWGFDFGGGGSKEIVFYLFYLLFNYLLLMRNPMQEMQEMQK